MKSLKFFLLTVLVAGLSLTLSAQKFGHVNSNAILASMPEVKMAESNLEALTKQLQAKGQQMVTNYQNKVAELQQNEADYSQNQLAVEAEKLQKTQNEIGQFEQDMMIQIDEKRASLLQPILDKVQSAIDDVAETEGYTFVFDSGTGALLFAADGTDITEKVKAKLGL
jgi:outer membrane protein